MGIPGPQPRSTTVAPRGSALAQSRTRLTPIVFDRALINSDAMFSYPFDRSIMLWPYQRELAAGTDVHVHPAYRGRLRCCEQTFGRPGGELARGAAVSSSTKCSTPEETMWKIAA